MIKLLYTSITAIMFIFMLWMVFWWIPIDISQGPVAKTVFIHVPLAWCSMVAIILVSIASNNLSSEKKSFGIRLHNQQLKLVLFLE